MTLETKIILYSRHNSLPEASSSCRTVLRCTTPEICDHCTHTQPWLWYILQYITLDSLCRVQLKSKMASHKCSLLSCESEKSGTDKYVSLSESESEIMKFRFGSEMKCLCEPHYVDHFMRYSGWHSRKCSDPCGTHKTPRKTKLGVISLDTAQSVQKYIYYRVIPG